MKAKRAAKRATKAAAAAKSKPRQLELVPAAQAKPAPAKASPRTGAEARRAATAAAPVRRKHAPAAAEPVAAAVVEAPRERRGATAEQMAAKQREISISEFFTKNRHLLGFDNPSKALLTTVKEAVDNSLDACEEAGILPELVVQVDELGGDRYRITVEDNGPGIVKAQIPKIFGKLLYGSKFHRLKQARGQQGIGISAAAMYGQLTTGKAIHVVSRVGKNRPAHDFEIQIDTRKNAPVVHRDQELADWHREHGTRVSVELVADYLRGQRFLTRYVEQTALANPHARIEYRRPKTAVKVFPRSTDAAPKDAGEIRPHPHGVELGALMLMAKETECRDLRSFLQREFSRVSGKVADEVLAAAGFAQWNKAVLRQVADDRATAERLHQAIVATRIMAPPTNCLSPIGEDLIHNGLKAFLTMTQEGVRGVGDELDLLLEETPGRGAAAARAGQGGEGQATGAATAQTASEEARPEEGEEVIKGHKFFITSVTRPPRVYRGNPFEIEVGLAYGGPLPQDQTVELYRFANRVPLLFQRSACAVTQAVIQTDWRNYQLSQPKGSLPVGPMILFVHIASVWVPFTSESKEAIAQYPEIVREVQLALQECGRKLATFIRRREHAEYEAKRRSLFELYIQEIAASMKRLAGANPERVKKEFLSLAEKFTPAADLDDAALAAAAGKAAANPRRPVPSDNGDAETGAEPGRHARTAGKTTAPPTAPSKPKPAARRQARA